MDEWTVKVTGTGHAKNRSMRIIFRFNPSSQPAYTFDLMKSSAAPSKARLLGDFWGAFHLSPGTSRLDFPPELCVVAWRSLRRINKDLSVDRSNQRTALNYIIE